MDVRNNWEILSINNSILHINQTVWRIWIEVVFLCDNGNYSVVLRASFGNLSLKTLVTLVTCVQIPLDLYFRPQCNIYTRVYQNPWLSELIKIANLVFIVKHFFWPQDLKISTLCRGWENLWTGQKSQKVQSVVTVVPSERWYMYSCHVLVRLPGRSANGKRRQHQHQHSQFAIRN